jgi:predicted ATPase/class 3 adenylate cyclase/DNA-binding CsgD family transcriptional regulator
MPREQPRGTVTFLFTEIADAARLWNEAPVEMADAVRAHDAIVRETIERHGGYVFEVGDDGFGAVFSTAVEAAAAAVETQAFLRDEMAVPFTVRMALHTGEATGRDREYAGTDANRTSELVSRAHGGQILVSDAAEVLLRDRMTTRLLGEVRLRRARGRTWVHQLVDEGLPTDFPVLRHNDRVAGNLTYETSSIVGRDEVLDDIADLVRSQPLVTLVGVGGVGKTRLALEVAADVASEFRDGIWFIDLAAVSDPASVPSAIATALGITPQGDEELLTTIAESVAGRAPLFVFDNCEHVLAAARRAVEAILAESTDLRVLATSREPLSIDDEIVVPVNPLGLAGDASSDAAKLFVERARAVRPDFALHDDVTTVAVTDICRTLDGLPLGIELAAARMAAMSAVEVRDRLADRFRLLQRSSEGPERQLSLSHAVEWSYDLLTEDEREVFRLTSVFAGGFELASLGAVVSGDEVDVLRRLDSLVRKSLVGADHTSSRTRYRLFETIREFAQERLAQSGTLDDARDRHAVHFASAAAAHWEHWDGPGWRAASDWVESELDNLRSGYLWSAHTGDLKTATDIAAHAALMGFSVQLFETLTWAEDLVEPATAARVARLPRLCTGAGYACFVGRAAIARANAHRACELEREAGYDACAPGYAAFVEALGAVYCGDLDDYVRLTGAVAEGYGNERGYALAAYVDGLQSCGRTEEALALVEESVAVARRIGNPYWISYALWIAGMAFSKTDVRRAFAAWEEGVANTREHRVQFFEGFLARDAGRLHTSHGEAEAALVLFGEAIAAFHKAGNVPQLIITLASVPALFERLNRHAPAALLLGALTRQPSSFQHVPELAEFDSRLQRELGRARTTDLMAAGAALGLGEAAVYARQQIDAARREPVPKSRQPRPGGLSRREIEVLRLVADGMSNADVATELFISPRTAEHHIQNIYTKIGVSSRAGATRWALEHQVVPSARTRK